jgi:hypothetical protein
VPEAAEERKAEEPARTALGVTAPDKVEREKGAGEKPGKERAVLPPAEAEVAPAAARGRDEPAGESVAAESGKTYKALESKPVEAEAAPPPPVTQGEESIKPGGLEARGPEAAEEKQPEEPAKKALGVTAAGKEEKEKEAGGKPGKGKAGAPAAGAEAAPPAAGGKEEAAGEPAAVEIAPGDPGAMLESLGAVAPSQAALGLEALRGASAEEFTRQHQELADNPPAIPRPSGLPRKGGPEIEEKLEEGGEEKKPEKVEPGPGEQTKIEVVTPPVTAPLPVPPSVARSLETAPEEGEQLEAFAWASLNSVPTSDENVDTSAGPRPTVELSGEADPGQMSSQLSANRATFDDQRVKANEETAQDFGENDIYPVVPDEILTTSIKPKAGLRTKGEVESPHGIPPVVLEGFDREAAGRWSEEISGAGTKNAAAEQQRATDEMNAHTTASTEIASLEAEAVTQQTAAQVQARTDVNEARKGWSDEITTADNTYTKETSALETKAKKDIEAEKTTADEGARKELENAEREASEKKAKAEGDAAKKRAEGKKESGGFLGWLKSKAKALLNAIKDAVNFIFDQLRKAVKWIIDKAKKAAMWLIEKARQAIVGLIRVFGKALELAADVFLAAFPKARDKFKSMIRKGVAIAEDVVNTAADVLKAGVSAVLDALGAALDFVLELYQKAYTAIIDAIEFVVVGLIEIMEKIGYLVSAAQEMPDHFEGQMYEEILGMDLTQPLPFETTKPPTPEAATAAAVGAGVMTSPDAAVIGKDKFGEDDIGVDSVSTVRLEPELLASIGMDPEAESEDGDVEFGEISDPSHSIKAVREEAGGAEPEPLASAPSGETEEKEPDTASPAMEEAGGAVLSPEEETERRLQAMMAKEPEGTCAKEKPADEATDSTFPEELKFGPLTKGQRARYMLDQMWKGIKHWFSCNWPWLLAAAIGAIAGIILANILTGGLIMAALPIVLQIVAAVMVGVSLVRAASYLGDYLSKGWGGDIAGAAKDLARAIAIGAVELIFAILFAVTGGIFTAVKAAAKAAFKAAGKAAKAIGKAAAGAGKAIAKGTAKVGGAALRRGRVIMKGVREGFERGAKSLDDLARRLWKKVRFKKFKISRRGRRVQLFGYINPWVLLANGEIEPIVITGKKPVRGLKVKVPGRKKPGFVVGVIEETSEGAATASRFVDDLKDLPKSARKKLYKDLEKATAAERWAKIADTGLTARHAKDLRKAMSASGKTLKPGEAAHHLVPSTHPLAKEARGILKKFGMHFNDAPNGLALSDDLHKLVHSNNEQYIRKVTELLKGAKSKADVLATLSKIESLIKAKKLP